MADSIDFRTMNHSSLVKCPICGKNGRQSLMTRSMKAANAIQVLGARVDHKVSALIPGFAEVIDEHCNLDAPQAVELVVVSGRVR